MKKKKCGQICSDRFFIQNVAPKAPAGALGACWFSFSKNKTKRRSSKKTSFDIFKFI